MGDRCHVDFEIGGFIGTKARLDKLLSAIMDEYGHVYGGDSNDIRARYLREICEAHTKGEPFVFELDEVNYANTDELNTVLRELGLTFTKVNDAGGDYGPAKEMGNFPDEPYNIQFDLSHDSEPMISIYRVVEMMSNYGQEFDKEMRQVANAAMRPCPPLKLEGTALKACATAIAAQALAA